MAYEYIAGGAGDEVTLRDNRTRFDAIRLKPRVLRDVSKLDTSSTLFGQRLEHPILLAPTAYHKITHPEGEVATARGAGATHTTMCVSSFATTSIEDVAKAATSPLWFQLYVQPDRGFTKALVQRAEAAGCRALLVTCDTPVIGTRNRETRAGFRLPPGLERENLKGLLGNASRVAHVDEGTIYSALFDPALTWQGIDWIRSFAKVPVILKGILSPEDAALAVQHGAHGILVSNHGARNLDTLPATIDALPGIVNAVAGRIPVLMDGGIRRGTDVVKALALGAKAVLIGRPYLWGLSVGGADGVQNVMTILRGEFQSAMALCGRTSLAAIDRTVLWPRKL
jgi:4-hydroxymandelate oxidase